MRAAGGRSLATHSITPPPCHPCRSIVRSRTEAHPAFSPEHIYRDSMLGGDIAADAAKAAQACSLARLPGFRLRLLPPRWQNVSC